MPNVRNVKETQQGNMVNYRFFYGLLYLLWAIRVKTLCGVDYGEEMPHQSSWNRLFGQPSCEPIDIA